MVIFHSLRALSLSLGCFSFSAFHSFVLPRICSMLHVCLRASLSKFFASPRHACCVVIFAAAIQAGTIVYSLNNCVEKILTNT
jgi:hypothetical protein